IAPGLRGLRGPGRDQQTQSRLLIFIPADHRGDLAQPGRPGDRGRPALARVALHEPVRTVGILALRLDSRLRSDGVAAEDVDRLVRVRTDNAQVDDLDLEE